MKREEIIQTAYDFASQGKFFVQASFCGTAIPDKEVKAYEERAWDIIKNVSIDKLDESYNMVLFAGVDEEDMTAEELLRYIGSYAQSEYETLMIEKVVLWNR